jgi:signal peptidase
VLLLGLLAAVYLIINIELIRLSLNPSLKTYILQPFLWGVVAVAVLVLPRGQITTRPRLRSTIIQIALFTGFIQVLMYCVGGLYTGFGKSPSSFTGIDILGNLLFVGSSLVGLELSRAWLMKQFSRHPVLALMFISIIFTVLWTPLSQLTTLTAQVQSINYIDSALLPMLAANLLASLLALWGGPLASIAYMGMLQAFWWFVPILPNLTWSIKGLIGTAVPVLALILVRNYYVSKTERRRAMRAKEGSMGGWVVTAIISVAMVWFGVGLFPVHPSLVGSGSMSPVLRVGDITIIAKTPLTSIKVGDIIEYRNAEKIDIVHRVIKIEQVNGTTEFITKGDANNVEDSAPVLPDNVLGKVVFDVPKVGWLAVAIKGLLPH